MLVASYSGALRALASSSASTSFRCLHATAALSRGRFVFFNKHRKVTDPKKQDPNYFEDRAKELPLDEHYVDALKMLWEEKIGAERELLYKAEDRLVATEDFGLPKIDAKAPRFAYKAVDVLRDAPESVKKIFSVEFGHRHDLSLEWKHELIEKVKLHSIDTQSHEHRIGYATALIRHWSLLVDDMAKKNPRKPRKLLHRIWKTVNHRRRLLRELREANAEAFERVIKELKISYTVPKQPEHVKTRKAWSEAQLRKRVDAEKEKRLEELHKKYLEGRDTKMSAMEKRRAEIEMERNSLLAKEQEILALEGKTVAGVVGKYQPQLVGYITEHAFHSLLFYHPKPDMVKQ